MGKIRIIHLVCVSITVAAEYATVGVWVHHVVDAKALQIKISVIKIVCHC